MDIVVRWAGTREHISLNLDKQLGYLPITKTRDVWDDGTVVDYTTTSEFKQLRDGMWHLMLSYDRLLNPVVPDGTLFGTTTIAFKASDTQGTANWVCDTDSTNNGYVSWKALDTAIFKTKKTVQREVKLLERRQQAFRNLLKGRYGQCAISGERTLAALEAAHVIPSRDGGAESIGNGFFLRADLHRLFDAREFGIDSKGMIILPSDSTLSADYQRLLKGKNIPSKVFESIKSALGEKSANKVRS